MARGLTFSASAQQVSPCKKPTSACPIFYTDEARLALKADEVECINTKTDLDNCGGCTSIGMGQSCVDIPFARNVACVHGKCEICTSFRSWVGRASR